MKSKGLIAGWPVICVLTILLMTTCKKKEEPPQEPEESGQSTTDSRDAQSENDVAVDDINNIIGDNSKLRGKSAPSSATSAVSGVTGTLCGVSLDSVDINIGSIKINYNGTTCNNRTRTGSIRLTIQDYALGKRWKQAGCIIKVEYLAYKVTRASDQKSMQLDGVQYLTNVSGGTWWELIILKTQTTLVSTITGSNLKVTFHDSKTATYNINRRVTYSIPGGILTCQAEGIGTSGSLTNLENFGTTRDGDAFTSQVSTPIIWNLTCGAWAPIQGKLTMSVANKGFQFIATWGVDTSGNPIAVSSNSCPYGWKLEWTYNNQPRSKVFGYH